MDTGSHAIDGDYTVIWLRPASGSQRQPTKGTITITHFNDDRNARELGADGEL